MSQTNRHTLLSGTVVTSLGTLASRILGLVRDTVTASLFGLASGGVLDALVIAFRIPNLFRALFGEGALTASYLPIFSESLEQNHGRAGRLFQATTRWLVRLLLALTIIGEIGLGCAAWLAREDSRTVLLFGLSAAMLPYLILVCLAALASATLQAVGSFAWPALAPAVLNICWIAGAAAIAPQVAGSADRQAYILAVCILTGGALQWAVQWPALWRAGFTLRASAKSNFPSLPPGEGRGEGACDAFPAPSPCPLPKGEGSELATDDDSAEPLRRIRMGMLPTMVALTVTQLNTLSDSIVAWLLAAPEHGSKTIAWLGVNYPLEQGAAAAIYLGERLYQFPLGLIGIAAGTAVFPLLSAHAARGDSAAVARDLSLGLRLVLWLAIPSSVGLVIFAEPIARLMFEHEHFTAADASRAAGMIAVYGSAVWAYCVLPVLVRGFYAMNDRTTPLRVALIAVVLNVALDFTLIWFFAERGLAAATAVSAIVQAALLAIWFSRRHVAIDWHKLAGSAIRASLAAAVMAAVGVLALYQIPVQPGNWNALLRLAIPLTVCLVSFAVVVLAVGRSDWREFLARRS
ncbi:MAG TPA: murein biosynthesis integral membrane protein MurJ [Pirellulales bacterium]